MAIDFNLNLGKRRDAVPPAGNGPALQRYSATQLLFLDRLTRLVRKVHLHGRYLVPTDRRMQLLNRALLSTFCDCRELGIETEARAVLAGLQREMSLALPAPEHPL
ncbi:MAG: hypothetical protein M3Q65_08410 [Chloroflexota bacterium]|nr:hypothetical protein [Chloroflexota bacterium]